MNIQVEIIGFLEEEIPSSLKGPKVELNIEKTTNLYDLLTKVFRILDTDKVVLVNGLYQPLNYNVQNSDQIKIFPRLDGG
jgi:hypothetical protein